MRGWKKRKGGRGRVVSFAPTARQLGVGVRSIVARATKVGGCRFQAEVGACACVVRVRCTQYVRTRMCLGVPAVRHRGMPSPRAVTGHLVNEARAGAALHVFESSGVPPNKTTDPRALAGRSPRRAARRRGSEHAAAHAPPKCVCVSTCLQVDVGHVTGDLVSEAGAGADLVVLVLGRALDPDHLHAALRVLHGEMRCSAQTVSVPVT